MFDLWGSRLIDYFRSIVAATHGDELWTMFKLVSEKCSGLKSSLGLYPINVMAEVYVFIWVLDNYTLEKEIGVYICVTPAYIDEFC